VALRIEKLQVVGFKSFYDRTEIRLPGGITAVVGPNGCGKSNIGDAIHWVLGEQSARTLRGERMEDVIFAGSETRKPVGMAEVTLRLVSPDHAFDGRELVEISRRLYRSGESEYLIDGRRARLKDIQELLAKVHIGTRTSAVIEQGKVEALLTARPKDRRVLIEEAAGTIGYRQKKRLAEMKLEATEANLLRVSDIVAEVSRQIGSLKRQAAKARRYGRLLDQMRSRQRLLFARQARRLDSLIAEVRGRIAEVSDVESARAADAGRLEAAVERARQEMADLEAGIAAGREELHKLDLALDREENRRAGIVRHGEELEAEASRLEEELAGLAQRDRELGGEIARWRDQALQVDAGLADIARRRAAREEAHAALAGSAASSQADVERVRRDALVARDALMEARNDRRALEDERRRNEALARRLSSELEAARREIEGLQSSLEAARAEREAAEDYLADLTRQASEHEEVKDHAIQVEIRAAQACDDGRRMRAASEERLNTLSDAATRFSGRNEGVAFILTRGGGEGIRSRGVVADYLRAGAEVERAAEGYLSEVLPAVLVEENEDVVRGVEALRREGAGRCLFLAERNGHLPPAERRPISESLAGESGVLGLLGERLRALAPFNGLITGRLRDAVLVESLKTALDLHGRYPGQDFVTRDGDVVYSTGFVAGGRSTSGGEGLLAQTRAIGKAREDLGEAASRTQAAEELLASAKAERARAELLWSELLARRTELEKSVLSLRLKEQRIDEDLQKDLRSADTLAEEEGQAWVEGVSLSDRFEEAARLVLEREAEVSSSEEALLRADEAGRELQDSLLASGEDLGRLRSEEAALSERREGVERELVRLAQAAGENASRREQAAAFLQAARSKKTELEAEAKDLAVWLAETTSRRVADGEALAARERSVGEAREGITASEALARGAREGLEGSREERQQAEIQLARLAADRDHVDQRCREELSLSVDEAQAEVEGAAKGEEQAAPLDEAACESELGELRRKLQEVGPVNMMALEQFTELEGRYQFLSAQQKDLKGSIESLRETIRKINRTSRDKFLEAFEAVGANFNEVFRMLFGGGRAELRLEEGPDPLEAGLEVIAQPPGKRLQNISLLSGGEKAMAAIALLFAVFRYQPSPFCLMDEVDAALDEANVGRFCRMLEQYCHETQFIVVTHNPRSMEAADILYGVTMPEPGISRVVSMRLPEAVATVH